MTHKIDIRDLHLNYNPEAPQERFKAAGLEAALLKNASDRLPGTVPWPAGKAPIAAPLAKAPAATEDLTKFHGYDAVVVTWTSAEAAALAALFTPGYKTSDWYEYRHGVAAYIPLVTGPVAIQRQGGGHGAVLSQPRPVFSLQNWKCQGARDEIRPAPGL